MSYHADAFEATTKIVAAAMEEAEVELSTKGGEAVADFFSAIYKSLRMIAMDEERPERTGTYEVYQDNQGKYRFRLKATNGQIIAVSEGYNSKDACMNGIESVRKNASNAFVKEV